MKERYLFTSIIFHFTYLSVYAQDRPYVSPEENDVYKMWGSKPQYKWMASHTCHRFFVPMNFWLAYLSG